jgi:hypothetical protein
LTERRADIARAALQAERLQRPPQGVDCGLVNRKRIVVGGTCLSFVAGFQRVSVPKIRAGNNGDEVRRERVREGPAEGAIGPSFDLLPCLVGMRGGAARTFLLQLQNVPRPRYVRNHFAGRKIKTLGTILPLTCQCR